MNEKGKSDSTAKQPEEAHTEPVPAAVKERWEDAPGVDPASQSYAAEVEQSLNQIEEDARSATQQHAVYKSTSWEQARKVVELFRPVPWFIWRISNHVLGRSAEIKKLPQGLVLGLQRLLIAAANDPFFSDTRRVKTLKRALEVLQPDTVAALSVIHSVCRRLANRPFERIWRPILDDALLRAQIGLFVGERHNSFGAGRGMLAGFAGRCGLAIIIATGNLEQATRALELLAGGADIADVGISLYGCDPLQASAMVLSASGCGRDAAFGTVSFAVAKSLDITESSEQFRWLSAFTMVEFLRTGREESIDPRYWQALNYCTPVDRADLVEITRNMVKTGHTLQSIL